jgi:hypothetical protein
MDTMEFAVRLFSAIETRPSRCGTRADGKVCDAKPGECRYNPKYYSAPDWLNSRNAWALHEADGTCDLKCPYLISTNKEAQLDAVVENQDSSQHRQPEILPNITKDTVMMFGGDKRSRHHRFLRDSAKQQAGA